MLKINIKRIFQPAMLAGILYLVIETALDLLCAWVVSMLLENAIKGEWHSVSLTVAVLCAVVSSIALRFLHRWCQQAAREAQQNYREFICRSVIYGDIEVATTGELSARMETDANTITQFYTAACPETAASALSLLVCLAIFILYHGGLAVLFLGMSLLQLIPTLVYEKWAKAIYMETLQNDEEFSDWINAGLRGAATLKTYCQEPWFISRLKGYRQAVVVSAKKENTTATVEDVITELVNTLLQYGSYLILGAATLSRWIMVAQIPLLLVLSQHMFSAVAVMVKSRLTYFKYQQALARLEKSRKADMAEKDTDSFVLQMENISRNFGEKTVLSHISVQIHPGDRILLKGQNGAGKTTLLRILLGLDDPNEGTILRGPQETAFALQEEPALKLTMRELADELVSAGMIDQEKFMQHMQAFGNEAMLDCIPEQCSAGQRKKFYLSLALARMADFLVLDEPTNHLDAESTEYLCDQLTAYQGTLLVCSHDERLSMQRIWRMEGGQIYET